MRFIQRNAPRRRRRGGFTLMEVGLTITIVGVGVMAVMELLCNGTLASRTAYDQTSAINLAQNVRELIQLKTATQTRALNGTTYSPPVDATGTALSGLTNWSQVVTVVPVDPDNVQSALPAATVSGIMRATVSVKFNGAEVNHISWLVTEAP